MTTTKPPVLTIPRSLLGKIVDEVFDGACEDTSAIEDIYRIIISEQAVLERAGADAVRDAGTPAAQWRVAGEPDPHAGHYDCERAELAMGDLTDDELANGAFLNYDRRLDIDAILNKTPGYHPPIAWMTSVNERIRWLSRKLESAGEEIRALKVSPAAACATCKGSGVVPDGEITGSGGVPYENGPVLCVKDCPDCTPAAAVADAKPCTYCDGTGDVHGFDGEWRGTCTECDAAPQAGQLSGNAGEVDTGAWQGWATQKPDRLPKLWGARHIAELNWDEDGDADLIRLVEVERIAASKGANHG